MITDLCLCEYTDHGHCGVVREHRTGSRVDNDATLELLTRTAISQAQAGADIVAPSDMMDGRIGAIRAGARRGRATRTRRSWPTPPSTPRPSTGRSARPPIPRPRSATVAAIRWTRPTATRRCASRAWTWRRAPTSLMVKPALPYLDMIRRVKDDTACRWPPTTQVASTRCSRPRPRPATWMSAQSVLEALTGDQARGSRHHHHLPRKGRGAMAAVDDDHPRPTTWLRAEAALAQGRRGGSAR